VLDRDIVAVASSAADGVSPPFDLADHAVVDVARAALAGRHPQPAAVLLPWDATPLVLAEPVLVDGEVRGAVLTVSPTEDARARVLTWWGVVAIGGVVALVAAVFVVALPVVRWILRPVRRLDDATGSLVGNVVAGHQVARVADEHGPAELRHLTRSFDQMAASVGDTLAAQRAFIADASHQLRNPLTALRLRLDNLDGQVHADATGHLTAALAETDRLRRILDDLLSMARAEGTGSELVAVEMAPAVADRVADWRVVAASRQVDLELTGGEAMTRVLAPPRAVDDIVDALLDNALKFTGPGTRVLVELGRRDGGARAMATVAVRDHGPGLAPHELDRATDRFWRSRTHQNVPGSGLGLAIVRRIAERAGGTVHIELPSGGGLLVTVTLPLASD